LNASYVVGKASRSQATTARTRRLSSPAVTDWASQGGNQIPGWTPPLLVGSLVADGVLLSLALTAGILLVLPVCARHTSRP
jgi:hypothetical protein